MAPPRLAAGRTRCSPYSAYGGASNVPPTSNLSIKQIERVGRAVTIFDNYRLRLLLHCGGCNRRPNPLRAQRTPSTVGGVAPIVDEVAEDRWPGMRITRSGFM